MSPVRDWIVMVTDIVQSTSLARSLGAEWPAVLALHDELVDRACSQYDGRRSGFTGDGFSYLFDDAAAAVSAAAQTVQDIDAAPWPDGATVRLRIGLHVGQVHESAGAFSGVGIHEAARVAALAGTGRVLISDAVHRSLAEPPRHLRIVDLGPHDVRDLPGPTRLYSVEPVDPEEAALGEPLAAPGRTLLFGRADDLDALRSELDHTPVVSVVGPGGIGKTSLATELYRTHAGDAVLIDLTRLEAGRGLEPNVVDVLARGAPPGSTAAEAIGSRSMLLVLDNCEHVAPDVRSLCNDLVVTCPRLRVLTTSRQVLGIDGERVWFAPPLPESAAVELFRTRAAIAIGQARADALDPAAVEEVCRRVDRMPLAIELVAARLRAFGLLDLLAHLDDQPRLLVDRTRSPADRRHGIATAIDQSVETVGDSGRAVFGALSVFRGGADLDGIGSLLPERDSLAVLDDLEELVDASLVQRTDGPDGRSRYGQLEPVRQFADRALLPDERSQLQDRHANWVVRVVGPAGREVFARLSARQLLDAESANIEQALAHLVSTHRMAEAMRVVSDLGYHWFSDRPALGWDLTERVLDAAAGDEPPRMRAAALISAGQLLVQQRRFDDARKALTEALELLGGQPSRARGWARFHLGRTEAIEDWSPESITAFEMAFEDFVEVGDRFGQAWTLLWLAQLCGEVGAARSLEEELLVLARSEGLDHVLASALVTFEARHAFRSGRPDEAHRHLAEAVSIFERLGDRWQLADTRISAAGLCLSFDEQRSWDYLRVAALEMGHEAAMAHASHFLGVAAEALRRRGESELACQLAWAVEDTFIRLYRPRSNDLAPWADACRALGPAPQEPLDREEAVALAVAAILAADA